MIKMIKAVGEIHKRRSKLAGAVRFADLCVFQNEQLLEKGIPAEEQDIYTVKEVKQWYTRSKKDLVTAQKQLEVFDQEVSKLLQISVPEFQNFINSL